jgi:O-antigen ligase
MIEQQSVHNDQLNAPDSALGRWEGTRRRLDATRLGVFDAVALLIAISMLALCVPDVYAPYLWPRVAVLVLIIPCGIALLAWSMINGDRVAALAGAVLGSAVLSSMSSPAVEVSLLGTISSQQSTLIIFGGYAAFEVGRRVSEDASGLLGWAVVAGAGLSAIVAVAQLATQPESGILALTVGRPSGLSGHSVFFAAHMCAAVAWFAHRVARESASRADLAGFGVFAVLGGLSGSRLAVAVPVALAIVAAIRSQRRVAWALVPIAFISAVASAVVLRVSSVDSAASGRLASANEGVGDRLDNWRFGVEAWGDRPLLGWGPGRYQTASFHHVSDEWVGRTPWADAHNVFVEVLTTQGIVGLLLVAGFVMVAVQRARGPMAWMAAAISVGWLLEPAPPTTFALGLLLLGAGMPMTTHRPLSRAVLALPAIVGIVLFGWSSLAMLRFDHATSTASTDEFSGVNAWNRFDPRAAIYVAERNFGGLNPDEESVAMMLTWTRRAVDLEPDSPTWRSLLALRYLQSDDLRSARVAGERALQMQPNQTMALQVLYTVGVASDDERLVEQSRKRLCDIPLALCPPP